MTYIQNTTSEIAENISHASGAPEPDAFLRRLIDEWAGNITRHETIMDSFDDDSEHSHEMLFSNVRAGLDLEAEIARVQARTIDGLRLKAQVAARYLAPDDCEMLRSIVGDLLAYRR